MITITAQEICRACSGELLAGSAETPLASISTDTRGDLAGRLFIALKGERYDANDFIDVALEKGAAGVLAERSAAALAATTGPAAIAGPGVDERPEPAAGTQEGAVIIAVDDTGVALKRLAALVAGKSKAAVVAITGSTGKTSTKDILASLLSSRAAVVASHESFNNEVGVPLTLLAADEDTRVIVVEMGMQAPGEIRELCSIVPPGVGIITNIAPAHLEHAGSLENIAAGKAELADCLTVGGSLVVPFGEALLEPHLRRDDIEIITFGYDTGADIHPVSETSGGDYYHSVISCRGEEIELEFNFNARHQLLNAMAAIGAYYLLGLPLAELSGPAAAISFTGRRGEMRNLPGGATLINDCYNANPLSMVSALEHLANAGAGHRTIAILGDMGELGAGSPEYHLQVGQKAAELEIDRLVAIGESAAAYVEGAGGLNGNRQDLHLDDVESALAVVPGLVERGDYVLVKASRFMRLERICDALAAAGDSGEEG